MPTLIRMFQRALLAFALWATATSAMALQWNFSYDFTNSGERAFASGVLTTTDVLVSGSYTITAVTGTRTFDSITNSITGLLAPGAFLGNDNLLFPVGKALNNNGFSFTIDGNNNGIGGNELNVYFENPLFGEASNPVGFGNFTISAVPEPSAALLAGGGLALLLAAVRRRARQDVDWGSGLRLVRP